MKRRKIIKLAAYATGAALSAPLMSSLLTGCKSEAIDQADIDYQLQFLNEDEFKLVRKLANIILPKTDSPSASDVGVHRMIDHMVATVYKKEDKESYQKKLASLVSYLNPDPEKVNSFLDLEAKEQLGMVQKLSESKDENLKDAQKAFLDLRQQSIAYYLSSEEIGKNYLNYLPVPGEYQSCISLEEAGGKAWAL